MTMYKNGNSSDAVKLLLNTDLIKENFVKVNIYVDPSTVRSFIDQPAMTPADFLSKIGGTLNLYSGISFIVVLEIIDLLYCIFCKVIKKTNIKPLKENCTANNQKRTSVTNLLNSKN